MPHSMLKNPDQSQEGAVGHCNGFFIRAKLAFLLASCLTGIVKPVKCISFIKSLDTYFQSIAFDI